LAGLHEYGKQPILYPYHGARHRPCSEADEHDKAEAAMHEARKALDKNQLLLVTAIDALKMATAEAKAATHHAKILEEEHGHLVRSLVFHVFSNMLRPVCATNINKLWQHTGFQPCVHVFPRIDDSKAFTAKR